MIGVELITVHHFDPDKFETRDELVYPDSVLDEMARRVGDKLDEEILARLGYVKPVRCRNCDLSQKDGTRCVLFAGWEPIEGSDEYELVNAEVEPDGFCAWGKRREEHDSNTTGGDLMNATDELHKLLDERGVKWEARTSPTGSIWTYWDTFNGYRVYARDNENGTVKIFGEWDVTPEQAIEATLGRGTCHMRLVYEEEDADGFIWPDHYECSVCGANVNGIMTSYDTEIQPRFCPKCGAEVDE